MPVCNWLENNITLFSAGHALENSNLTRKCPIKKVCTKNNVLVSI